MRQSPVADSHRKDPDGASRSLTYAQGTHRYADLRRAAPQLVPELLSRSIPNISRDPAQNPDPSLFERLSHRKLVQWIVAYLAAAWLLLQLTDVLSEIWMWPVTLQRAVSLVLGMGLLPAIVVAWFHGEKGRQHVCALEVAILGMLVAFSYAVIWYFCGGLIA